MQIHEDICFCVMHLLRACCDYECYNFGIVANFVCNMVVYYFEMYDIFVCVCNVNMSCIFSNLRFLKNDSVCAL